MVQKAAATSMVGQSFAWLKSPEAAIPLIVSVPVPLLVSLIDCAELVAPRRCPPKSRLLGLSLACGVGSGRASDQAPRPWVQAMMEDASAVRVKESTRAFGMPLPSAAQFGAGVVPPQVEHQRGPVSVPA